MQQLADTFSWAVRGQPVPYDGICTDTRGQLEGALFVALEGENHDAHRFVEQALAQGAAGAVVHKPVAGAEPLLVVEDTLQALGQIAALHRQAWEGELFAVTGSAGKTTTKEMLAAILAGAGNVLATRGNYNNEVGVPLTLFGLERAHSHAVIEMGAAKAGDIAYLVSIAQPATSILTNAMGAHLEGFGDLATIVRTKGEIFVADPACVSVINLDDPNSDHWLEQAAGSRIITCSAAGNEAADVRAIGAEARPDGSRFTLVTPLGNCEVNLQVPGIHNIANALAAAGAALARDIDLDVVRAGLEQFSGVAGRLQLLQGRGGLLVIDDSYNANPAAVRSALDVLASQGGKRAFLFGRMAELGPASAELHRGIGDYARELGIDALLAVGEEAGLAAEAFGEGGQIFADLEMLASWLDEHDFLAGFDACLVKGSRSAGMERAVKLLLAEGGQA